MFSCKNFAGESTKICLETDKFTTNFNLKSSGFDKPVSSWICGKDIAYKFCLDDCDNIKKPADSDESIERQALPSGFMSGAGSGRNPAMLVNKIPSV